MGKSLVIRSADFSEVGFKLEYVEKVVTQLYNSANEVVTNWAEQTTYALGKYYYENDAHQLVKAGNLEGIASTQMVDVEDYQFAQVYTKNWIGTTGSIVLGIALMVFVDANQQILGGFSTANEGLGTITKGVGKVNSMTEFSMEIPTGTKYVVCSFTDEDAGNDLKNFKLTLRKLK